MADLVAGGKVAMGSSEDATVTIGALASCGPSCYGPGVIWARRLSRDTVEACGHMELSFEPFVACVDVEVCLRGEACRREVVIVGTADARCFVLAIACANGNGVCLLYGLLEAYRCEVACMVA